jgi:hypothetical protein
VLARQNAPAAGYTFVSVNLDFYIAGLVLKSNVGCFHRASSDAPVTSHTQIVIRLNDLNHSVPPPQRQANLACARARCFLLDPIPASRYNLYYNRKDAALSIYAFEYRAFFPCKGKSIVFFAFLPYTINFGSMDKTYITGHEGIRFQNIIDFLLEDWS